MKIFIIHASAGAGHRKAAEALALGFKNHAEASDVRVIDILDHTNPFFKKAYPQTYMFMVKYLPFVWGAFFYFLNISWLKPVINFFRKAANTANAGKFIDLIRSEKPDAVICLHFMSAQLVSELKRTKQFSGKVFCGVTDFGVHQFWINQGTDFYFVASSLTKEELLAKGVDGARIKVSGIPISDRFSLTHEKSKLRLALGLDPDKFTVLVTSGGFGVGPIKKIISSLDQMKSTMQLITVCGTNQALCSQIRNFRFEKTNKVFAYVNNMDELMSAADMIISKSGGLTVSESLAKSLPMMILKPIPGQETRNAEVLEKYGAGLRLNDVRELEAAISRLIADDYRQLRQMQDNARAQAKPGAANEVSAWVMENLRKNS